jgi:hypothetical protein
MLRERERPVNMFHGCPDLLSTSSDVVRVRRH